MESIAWDPSLETGDALVDEQHREMHDLLNELVSSGDSPSRIMSVLERLMDHALLHFADEEDLMRREAYPAELSAEHIAQHRALTESARQKVLEFHDGTLTEIGPLVEFLREWVGTHIHEHDRGLVDYVRERNGLS